MRFLNSASTKIRVHYTYRLVWKFIPGLPKPFSQPLTLPVRGLTLEPEHRKNPLGLAEIAPAETAGADYGEVGGASGQHLIGKVRGRYFEVKIAQRLVFHPRSYRRPHGFKTCEEMWKSMPDHL